VSRVSYVLTLPYSLDRTRVFRRLVRESYLLERQSQGPHAQGHDTEQHTQASTLPLPLLAKYGHWIRQLPSPDTLCTRLKNPDGLTQQQQGNGVDIEQPTNYDLMRHLYKHCPALEVHQLSQASNELISDDFLKIIAEYVIPRTRHLYLYGGSLEFWRLMYLLDHGSNILESFTTDVITIYCVDERGQEESQKDAKPWKLKRLGVLRGMNMLNAGWCWSWLWKRCGQVEQLEVMQFRDFFQSLVEGIRTHMPKLNKLILRECDLDDNDVAALLSSSHHGWKEIVLEGSPTTIKGPATEALMQQCSVLEKFVADRCEHFSGHDTVRVLASSPNLHTSMTTRVDANVFVDRYPHTGSLRAWACEASLTSLRVGITGVPRPDLPECRVQELYPGQGREIQSQAYDRLARLTKLESLWLGQTVSSWRLACLELSLESGLHKLSGLRSLKELGVMSLALKIGVEEVQWMAESWPELRTIHGMDLSNESPCKEAVEWLQRNRPEIRLR